MDTNEELIKVFDRMEECMTSHGLLQEIVLCYLSTDESLKMLREIANDWGIDINVE